MTKLLYCGFASHLPFKERSEDLVKNLNGLRWTALQSVGDTTVAEAWPGWCALFVRTNDGRLFHYGYDSPDKLPTGEVCGAIKDTTEDSPLAITAIEWGSKQSFIVTSNGQLRKWVGSDFTSEPQIVPSISGADCEPNPVQQVSAGTTFACVLFEDGSVKGLDLEADIDTAETVDFKLTDDEFVSIACGNEHLIMLSKRGRVYTYGHGAKGQLGHGVVEDVMEEAKLVEALDGVTITRIAAGGWHSMALSATGDLYAFGWNESGQLGFAKSDLPLTATPLLIDGGEECNYVSVSCGSRHSMAVTEKGELFAFGWNKYGQVSDLEI